MTNQIFAHKATPGGQFYHKTEAFLLSSEWDELKDFVMENVQAINEKLEWKLEVIPNKSTLMQICQMLRALAMDQGHVLMYGTSLISPVSLMELVCKIKGRVHSIVEFHPLEVIIDAGLVRLTMADS